VSGRLNAMLVVARVSAGPLVLSGFFLPWAHGAGPLAATVFTGFTLIGFAGRLVLLDLTPGQSVAVWAVRLLVLGVAVAAAWQTLLAPAHRWHPAYAWSGWYLVAGIVIALSAGVYRSGIVLPTSGLLLWLTGAGLFVVAEFFRRRLTATGHAARPSPGTG
jgi:hypothetical protein